MKIAICLAFFVISILASKTNTTKFFEDQVGHIMDFQTFSGYEDIDWYYPKDSAAMYYSFAQGLGKSLTDKNIPLIVYLEGGPGYSSQQAAFNHVGPLSIQGDKKNFTISQNVWSWVIHGHMIFVDQPLNVGFSYSNSSEQVNNTYDAAKHFINFLHNFFQQWDLKDNPLYISGLSYAGHYIPAIARDILLNTSLEFNLKGIMIGGAWVDPASQLNFYDSYLYSVGIVSEEGRSTTSSMQNEALIRILNEKYAQAGGYIDWVLQDNISQKYFGGVNTDNYRLYGDSNINYHFGEFLEANKKQFGVPDNVSFKWNNQKVFAAFVNSGDYAQTMSNEFHFILNRGLKTMLFNGQNDIDVSTPGVLTFLNTIEWHDLPSWQRTSKQSWQISDKKTGWVKKFSNLIFVFIRNAGHLSPADQPKATLTMVNNFIHGIW